MPGWHRRTEALRRSGDLNVVGIVQEQHPDRARLFQQWQGLDGPIVVDSLNLLGVTVVPIHLLVRPDGTIHAIARDPDQLKGFLEQAFIADGPPPSPAPSLERLAKAAEGSSGARHWRDLGDARFLWGTVDSAIEAYSRASELDSDDATARFRLGVALRRRYETDARQPDDFLRAVTAWSDALDRNPSNYIWRRRIQQYGPRLAKPYPFYDWVAQAREDIAARGETPVALVARLTDSERLDPRAAEKTAGPTETPEHPDPDGKLPRDAGRLVGVEPALAPARVAAGSPVRLHLLCRPDAARKVHWNNEAGPLQIWLDVPDGWTVDPIGQVASLPKSVESTELRALEFEVTPAGNSGPRTDDIEGVRGLSRLRGGGRAVPLPPPGHHGGDRDHEEEGAASTPTGLLTQFPLAPRSCASYARRFSSGQANRGALAGS